MPARTIIHEQHIFLAALRSAADRGVTTPELYDGQRIARPEYLSDRLENEGHVIERVCERDDDGCRVMRYTLRLDGELSLLS